MSRLDELNVWLWFYLALMFVGVGAVVFAQVVAGWERDTGTIPIRYRIGTVVVGTPQHIEILGVVLTILGGLMACIMQQEREKLLVERQKEIAETTSGKTVS